MGTMTGKKVVPQLRFNFYKDYFEYLFGDIYSFISTNSFSRDKMNYKAGDVHNIHYGDILTKFQTIFYLENEYVPLINKDVDLSKFKYESYCKIGDLIIADASEDYAGIGTLIEIKSLNNTLTLAGLHTIHARPTANTISLGYGAFLMKSWSVKYQIMRIAQGTKVLGISAKRLAKLKLHLPSLPEQKKIATFLSSVDDKLQQLTKKKELLQSYKKGIMQKIFSQDLRFKDTNGNNYPQWQEKKLGDISKVYQPKTISQTNLTETGYDVYGANGVIGKYHSYNHKFQQIAVTCRGNTCGTINLTKKYAWITGNAMVVNLDNSDYCNKCFVYFQLCNTNFRYLITGSGQPQITGDIKSHKLQLPSLPEQEKIANFLSSIDSKIELVSKQIENTKVFKKGLLQQMFV